MSTAKIYTIHYQLHGQPKSFVVRAEVMNNAEAWHWAAVDADIAHVSRIGRVGHEQVKKPPAPGRRSSALPRSPGLRPSKYLHTSKRPATAGLTLLLQVAQRIVGRLFFPPVVSCPCPGARSPGQSGRPEGRRRRGNPGRSPVHPCRWHARWIAGLWGNHSR